MKIRINYAEANAAAAALYRDIIAVNPWLKSRATYNYCLKESFRALRAEAEAAAAPNASEAWEAMEDTAKLDYLMHAAYLMPRRAETNTRKDPATGERIAAPSPIADWIGKEEAREDAFALIASEAYTALPRYLERADEENRPLKWAIARATWAACSRLYTFYRPAGGRKLRAAGEEVEARLTAPRNAAPDAAALDRCTIEEITGESNAAAPVIEALDTLPGNAPQAAIALHISAAAGGAVNTAIFAAVAAGVEQRYIAAALDMTQQAVSYRLRKMRAAADDNAAAPADMYAHAPAVITTTANSAAPAPHSAAAPADMYAHVIPASPRHGDDAAAYMSALAAPVPAPPVPAPRTRPRKSKSK